MKKYLFAVKKAAAACLCLIVCLLFATELIYNRMATAIGDDRAIIFFYCTNVPGGQASAWQQKLAQSHPDISHLEIQCFNLIEQAGNSPVGMPSSQSGWQIISTRMAAGECDVLFLNKERYEFLLSKGHLIPIELPEGFDTSRALMQGENIMGVDMRHMQLEGLEFPCALEPHNRLDSTDTANPGVIMCLLKTASQKAKDLSKEILQNAVALPPPTQQNK